ncbi:putative dual specificity protein phosphatase 3 [Rasamsonia emersonii CBS 393.64]|uniref:Putative dual specificity protein phosphatase 3 n=1 Tax=Rasamsonia emersonii (strain ATCC 16479 / CBS 393.64 / IMI 116815) TaxID=1408163 RepID=A0A0F4YMU9_RASE3|nr:putative dual specificity protein phosphatase 3 [Rasamsonia emersonii CBS 393.64]KKA19569.1 putative dual specificity protein phosphatase 3 [Rasamsonia emersonii CBS 393.64]
MLTSETPMSHDEASPYVPTHPYSTNIPIRRLPVVVPPVALFDHDTSQFDTSPPSSHDFEYGEFVQSGFFQSVDPEWFAHKAQPADWTYEMRRHAQQVLPFLYLGPYACVKDRAFLEREGITLLLAVRSKQSAMARLVSGEKAAAELGIEADSIDVLNNQELIAEYPRAIRRINDHISSFPTQGITTTTTTTSPSSSPRKVLVFCESGNERSASVVIAYLMVMLNLSLHDALWRVQHRRFCVCIEEPMRHLLHSFESILTAKRDVTKAKRSLMSSGGGDGAAGGGNISLLQGQVPKKRGLDEGNDADATMKMTGCAPDMDMDMDMDADESVFPAKTKPAPFKDK